MSENNDSSVPKINLKSSDDELFEVDENVAMEFGTVQSFFEDDISRDTILPLPNVTSDSLSKIIKFYKQQLVFRSKTAAAGDDKTQADAVNQEIKDFKADFVKDESKDSLMELLLAANYLNVKELFDLVSQAVADLIKNKSVEYVREFFHIENDYTPEEEAELREKWAWAYEGVEE